MNHPWKKLVSEIAKEYEHIDQEMISIRDRKASLDRKYDYYKSLYTGLLSDTDRSAKPVETGTVMTAMRRESERCRSRYKMLQDKIHEKGLKHACFHQAICQKEYADILRLANEEKYEPALWFYGCYATSRRRADGIPFFEQLTASEEYGKRAQDALLLIQASDECSDLQTRFKEIRENSDQETIKKYEAVISDWDDISSRLKDPQLSAELKPVAEDLLNAYSFRTLKADAEKKINSITYRIGERKKKEREEKEKERQIRAIKAQEKAEHRKYNKVCLAILLVLMLCGNIGFIGNDYNSNFAPIAWVPTSPLFTTSYEETGSNAICLKPWVTSVIMDYGENPVGKMIIPFSHLKEMYVYFADSRTDSYSCIKSEEISVNGGIFGSLKFHKGTKSICLADVSVDELVIPDGVEEVRLYNVSSLSTLKIPNSVTSLQLARCSDLMTLDAEDEGSNLTSVSIAECDSFAKLMLPDSVREVKILDCNSLTDIALVDGVEKLDVQRCENLPELIVPDSVKLMKVSDCSNLKYMKVSDSLQKGFVGNSGLCEMDIPNSIADAVLYYYGAQFEENTMKLPNGLKNLVIADCADFSTLSLPNCDTEVGDGGLPSDYSAYMPSGLGGQYKIDVSHLMESDVSEDQENSSLMIVHCASLAKAIPKGVDTLILLQCEGLTTIKSKKANPSYISISGTKWNEQ